MSWDKATIITPDGKAISAQAPVIVSASRSTDIPAFYGDWFVERFKAGYVKWHNPFNGSPLYVSFKNTRLVVFWTKNPKPFIKHLPFLDENIRNYYFQFTLNDYDHEKLERKVPPLKGRIETFINLSEKISAERVIWRFDPLFLTDKIGVDELLKKIENIGDQLENYTRKLVFSFADIGIYKKVENNLKRNEISYQEFDILKMNEFANGLHRLNKRWNFELATCSEKIDLAKYGIIHNKCIDDDLIIRLFSNDSKLMKFLGVEFEEPSLFNGQNQVIIKAMLKDKGQREFCGCINSKDIGQYNTCPHDCVYCYANTSIHQVEKNYQHHKLYPNGETIIGK
ncbi:MAG: DUF1848 domain-containing protein [Ignavibacteriaceae bacterium]|jgi:DNA repair photolyase|nr:DUF1848 domain-containing protein [Ignavibacteriaceae bacterium]